jgi:hypothetical protein
LATTKVDVNLIDASGITSSKYLKGDGTWAEVAAGGGLITYTVYAGNATWLKSANSPTIIIVELQAAGGSGSYGSSGANVSSGSGGGYVRKIITDLSSITSGAIVIGAYGAGQSSPNSAGNDAANSTWIDGVNTLTAGGGKGGPNSSYGQAVGGTVAGGDFSIVGGVGAGNYKRGGSSYMGYPGMSTWTGEHTNGTPMGYGAGGGGSYGLASADGGSGVCIVWEYQ